MENFGINGNHCERKLNKRASHHGFKMLNEYYKPMLEILHITPYTERLSFANVCRNELTVFDNDVFIVTVQFADISVFGNAESDRYVSNKNLIRVRDCNYGRDAEPLAQTENISFLSLCRLVCSVKNLFESSNRDMLTELWNELYA